MSEALNKIKSKYHINNEKIKIDPLKFRIITSVSTVKRFAKKLKKDGLIPAVVEELPTYDEFEIEIEEL